MRERSGRDWPLLGALVLVVLVANLPYLSGWLVADPLGQRSELAVSAQNGPLIGVNVLDPNDGYVSQALGHRAALDLLHGHLPWWDPFEGAGAPLAGEMQSAALFPPTLLLALSNGQLYEHVLLELLAGLGTLLLLRRLGVGRAASLAGGSCFALNGTFAWFSHAPVNPIAALPWLLLGVELAYEASREGRRGRWWPIALPTALSIYAGFPETAYLNGLLVVAWAGWRVACAGRRVAPRLLAKLAAGAGAGILLAAPLLIAFLDTLAHSFTGSHAGLIGGMHLPAIAIPQLLLPYVYGPLLAFTDHQGQLADIWGRVGGYLTVLLATLAMLGLTGRSRRGLKLVLVGWVLLALARVYRQPPVLGSVLGVLPGMSSIYFYRYALPAVELAVIVLAAFGLDELARQRRRAVAAVTVLGGAVLLAVAVAAHGLVVQLSEPTIHSRWARAALLWGVISVAGVGLIALLVRNRRLRIGAVTLLMILDSAGPFVVRELAAPRSVTSDLSPVSFLRGHLGIQRFFTLGPIQPQYSAYFGLGSVNDDDVPVPKAWTDYVNGALDPDVNPLVFVGNAGGGRPATAPTPAQALASHLAGYRAAGVAYVLTSPGQALPPGLNSLRRVRRAGSAWIYRLDGAAPYFSVDDPGCSLDPRGRDRVQVVCTSPARLLRRELAFPGWGAQLDGRDVRLGRGAGIFQTVTVPRGRHELTFAYEPPHLAWGVAAFVVGLLWLGAVAFRGHRRGAKRAPSVATVRS